MIRNAFRTLAAVIVAVLLASLAVVARQKSGTFTNLSGSTDATGALNVTATGATGGQGKTGVLANLVLSNDASGYLKINCQSGCSGGGGGTPGGATTNVQYNDGGAFGGDANFTWNKLTRALFVQDGLKSLTLTTVNNGGSLGNIPFITGGTVASGDNLGLLSSAGGHHVFVGVSSGGAQLMLSPQFGYVAASGLPFAWSPTADAFAVPDTGFCRNAAGVAEVNNGTCGTLRDLLGRTLSATNGTKTLTMGTVLGSAGATNAAITGGTFAATNDLFIGGTNSFVYIGGATANNSHIVFTNNKVMMRSGYLDGWATSATDPAAAALDTALARNAAGVVEVNTGVAGSFGDLKLQMLRVGQTTVPTCSASCGTSPSVVGSDTAMVVTMGATGTPATPFTVTFNHTWASAPSCTATSGTAQTARYVTAAVTSTTTVVITTAAAPSVADKFNILCIGVS